MLLAFCARTYELLDSSMVRSIFPFSNKLIPSAALLRPVRVDVFS